MTNTSDKSSEIGSSGKKSTKNDSNSLKSTRIEQNGQKSNENWPKLAKSHFKCQQIENHLMWTKIEKKHQIRKKSNLDLQESTKTIRNCTKSDKDGEKMN